MSPTPTGSPRKSIARVPGHFWLALGLFVVTLGLQVWSSPAGGILGFELTFGKTAARTILDNWGEEGQRQAASNVKLDFLFIVGYVGLSLSVIRWAMRRQQLGSSGVRPALHAAVVAAGILDCVENRLLLRILADPVNFSEGMARAASWAALTKFNLLALAALILIGWLWRANAMTVQKVWHWLKDLQSILWLCRASVIVLAVGLAFLLLVPQGRDVVLALAEDPLRDRLGLLTWFFVAAGFWAANIWYWARVMLRFQWRVESRGSGRSGKAETLRKQVPRVLGTVAFLVVAAAFAKSATESSGKTALGHWMLSGWSVAFAAGFYGLTALRRNAMNAAHAGLGRIRPLHRGQTGKLIDLLAVTSTRETGAYGDELGSIRDLALSSRIFLTILSLLTAGLFTTFAIRADVAVILGAAPILLLAGAAWVVFGALTIYVGSRYDFPVLTLLLLLLMVFSLWNDNHVVRTMAPRDPFNVDSVATHFSAWLDERKISASSPDGDYPVVVVATEGGGIRAAYWTATALGKLQDERPEFADHLYAISGVSGGSLGGAVFAALVTERLGGGTVDCRSGSAEDRGAVESCAHEMLNQDFLSPTLAAMFYPDLVQRFLPPPIPHFDRGRALEKGWERAWSSLPNVEIKRFGGTPDDPSFDDLWRGRESGRENLYRVPLLFLNTTCVETGKRVIISPLPIRKEEFIDSEDFFGIVGKDVRLSSAVHNSARFSYVSPAGTVEDSGGETWGHLVDGGYFENSGATTALEVLQAMKRGAEKGGEHRWKKITPILLMITNDPELAAEKEPRRWLKEVLSPVVALLATRGARGSYSREALRAFVENDSRGRFVEIDLEEVQGVPLGWVLSGDAIATMKAEVEDEVRETLEALSGARPGEPE